MDNQQNIQYQVTVNTKNAEDNVKILQKQITELKNAVDKASQTDTEFITVDGTRKSVAEVIQMVNGLTMKLQQQKEQYLDYQNKAANKEADIARKAAEAKVDAERKAAETIANLRAKQAADSNAQWWRDQDAQRKQRTNDHQSAFESLFPNNFVASQQEKLKALAQQAETLQLMYQKTGDKSFLAEYNQMIPAIQKVAQENDKLTASFGRSRSSVEILGDTFRKHLGWALTGLGYGSIIAGTIGSFDTLKELEQEFNQLKTVLPELEHSQQTYNAAIRQSFELAEKYGTSIKDVTTSLRLMGRGYHELSESSRLAEIALKLSVADNFSSETATKSIEAVVGAYGKQAQSVQFATHVMDSMTAVSHNAQISGQDLSEALLRSAAAAKTVGVSYDELASMIAVISRNSGLSGATIGDGIKSILNSLHTDKAIKEIESLGVSVYKVSNSGQKEFRKITDVLLDMSIKAKSTGQNLEEVFRVAAGGKFQVSRASALLGDPNEFLKVLGTSINSSGFTDKQLEIQMSTIARKAARLKAEFQQLLTEGSGNSGLTQTIKGTIDALDRIIKGLNSIDPAVYKAIGGIAGLLGVLVALRSAIGFTATTFTVLRTAIVGTTVAQEALTAVTKVTPWGAIARLIVLAGTALATYAYYAGNAAEQQQKAADAAENDVTAKQSQIEMMKQQTGFMETLGNSYVNLKQSLAEVSDNEEKSAEIKRTMGTVSQQLAKIVGQEAADRILASEDVMGAISQEQQVHNEKITAMEANLKTLREKQIELTNDAITASNDRIQAIFNEADNVDIAAKAIETSLGKIDAAFYRYYKGKAQYFRDTADMLHGEVTSLNNGVHSLYDAVSLGGQAMLAGDLGLSIDQSGVDYANSQATDADNKAKEYADRAVATEQENQRNLLGKMHLYTGGGSYKSSPDSTGEVGSGGGSKGKGKGKGGGNGPAYAPDRQDQLEKLWANHEINKMFTDAKVAADQYEQSLASLQLQQDLFGQTAVTDATRLALMADRIGGLTKETDVLMNKRMDYEQKANDIVSSHGDMVEALNEKKTSWSSLSKDEKKDFIHAYLGETADMKLAISYLDNVEKLTGKIAANNKKITELSTGVLLGQKNNSKADYDRTMKRIGTDEQIETLQKGPKITEEEKRVIQLKSAVEQLVEAERRLEEIKHREHSAEELQSQQLQVEQLRFKVLDLKDAWKKVNEELANVLDQLLLQGKSLSSIFKDLTKQLASAVLKAAVTGKKVEGGGLLADLIPKFADGGVTNRPSIFGDDGEEVAIPVEKNTGNSLSLLNYAAQKLGVSNPTGVVPNLKNPDLGKQVTVNIQQNQSNAHVEELQRQTKVMQAMLSELMNGSGGGTVVPIVTQVSSTDVIRALQENPGALQSLLSQNRMNGYR